MDDGPQTKTTHRTLAFGPIAVALLSDEAAAADWLTEFLGPWFAPTLEAPEVEVAVSASAEAYAAIAARRPHEPVLRPCFAHDQRVISLPAWTTPDGVVVDDRQR